MAPKGKAKESRNVSEEEKFQKEQKEARYHRDERAEQEGKIVTDCFICAHMNKRSMGMKYDGVIYRMGEVIPTFGNHRNDAKLIRLGYVKKLPKDDKGVMDMIQSDGRRDDEDMRRLEMETS